MYVYTCVHVHVCMCVCVCVCVCVYVCYSFTINTMSSKIIVQCKQPCKVSWYQCYYMYNHGQVLEFGKDHHVTQQ